MTNPSPNQLKQFSNEEFLQELDDRLEKNLINLDGLIAVLQAKQKLKQNPPKNPPNKIHD